MTLILKLNLDIVGTYCHTIDQLDQKLWTENTHTHTHTQMDRQTDMCKTFTYPLLRVVIIDNKLMQVWLTQTKEFAGLGETTKAW